MRQTLRDYRPVVNGRYHVIEPLGSGGMGEVYLARDELLGRNVALKVLKEEYASSEEFKARFRQEAENAASLCHPNIVAVYDKGEDGPDGTPYMAMEHVPGGTLGERIARREGPLEPSEAAAIARQVALALGQAHRCGIVHRDIKPHNVFLAGDALGAVGAVKVGDFGIARAAEATAMTETNFILGSVHYLSPEQARGEPVAPTSDLYSLGVVLYEMLTGGVPFDGDGPIATAMKHISEPPPSPKRATPAVPGGLEAVTLKLLSKEPALRYPDASALAEDLERVARGLRPKARASAPPGGGAVGDASRAGGRPRDQATSATRRRGRRGLGRRVPAAVVGVSALLLFAAAAASAAGLYEIPWLAEVLDHPEAIAARADEGPSSPSEGEVPATPEEDSGGAPSEQRAEAETEAGVGDAPALDRPSQPTGGSTEPETQGVAEPAAYLTSADASSLGSNSERASNEPASKQDDREEQKNATKTAWSPSSKASGEVLGDKEYAAEKTPEEQEQRAEEATVEEGRKGREELVVEDVAKQEKEPTARKREAAPPKAFRARGQ